MGKYRRTSQDIIGPQGKRCDGQSQFNQVKYVVICSGACGDKGRGKKGQGGVGLTIIETITRAVVRPPEFINERLLKVALKLRRRACAVSFLVAYGPRN